MGAHETFGRANGEMSLFFHNPPDQPANQNFNPPFQGPNFNNLQFPQNVPNPPNNMPYPPNNMPNPQPYKYGKRQDDISFDHSRMRPNPDPYAMPPMRHKFDQVDDRSYNSCYTANNVFNRNRMNRKFPNKFDISFDMSRQYHHNRFPNINRRIRNENYAEKYPNDTSYMTEGRRDHYYRGYAGKRNGPERQHTVNYRNNYHNNFNNNFNHNFNNNFNNNRYDNQQDRSYSYFRPMPPKCMDLNNSYYGNYPKNYFNNFNNITTLYQKPQEEKVEEITKSQILKSQQESDALIENKENITNNITPNPNLCNNNPYNNKTPNNNNNHTPDNLKNYRNYNNKQGDNKNFNQKNFYNKNYFAMGNRAYSRDNLHKPKFPGGLGKPQCAKPNWYTPNKCPRNDQNKNFNPHANKENSKNAPNNYNKLFNNVRPEIRKLKYENARTNLTQPTNCAQNKKPYPNNLPNINLNKRQNNQVVVIDNDKNNKQLDTKPKPYRQKGQIINVKNEIKDESYISPTFANHGKNEELMYFRVLVNNDKTIKFCYPIHTKLITLLEELPRKQEDYEIYDQSGRALRQYKDKTIDSLFKRCEGDSRKNPICLRFVSPINLIDFKKEYAKTIHIIGALDFSKQSAIGIFTYNHNYNSVQHNYYSYSSYPDFAKINNFSAFCSAYNNLYVSGGDYIKGEGGEQVDSSELFLEINLEQIPSKIHVRPLPKLKYRRNWHSMIYIPSDSIYIVGGVLTKYVEVYNIKNQVLSTDSELIQTRCECSLALVNNKFLYAICGYNNALGQFNDTIERCNLFVLPHKWELVDINIGNINFVPSFFGVGYYKNNLILFGGKETTQSSPSYLLKSNENTKEDSISLYNAPTLDPKDIYIYREKFFIPFDNKISGSLVMNADNYLVQLLNMDDGSINTINF